MGVRISRVAGHGLGHRVVEGGGGGSVRQGAVRSAVVVFVAEGVEESLQLLDGGLLGGLGSWA